MSKRYIYRKPEEDLNSLANRYKGLNGTTEYPAPIQIAYLYLITFPNDMIYIGCTTRNIAVRIYGHKKGKRTPVSLALNKYDEYSVRILAIGEQKYILSLEADAIERFRANWTSFGYNQHRIKRLNWKASDNITIKAYQELWNI